jgi:hypothetical protein
VFVFGLRGTSLYDCISKVPYDKIPLRVPLTPITGYWRAIAIWNFAYFAPLPALREKNRRDVFIVSKVKDKIIEVNG